MEGDSGQVTKYGFNWGNLDVTRIAYIKDRGRILSVKTDHAEVEIYITEGGRAIHTFRKKGRGKNE